MLLNAICLTSASLAVHTNVIKELQKFHELKNLRITFCIIAQHNKIAILSWLIPDELATPCSYMVPGF